LESNGFVRFSNGVDPIPFLAQPLGNLSAAFVPMLVDGSLDQFKIGLSDSPFSDGKG
jgi:hypothetical protein